MPFTDAADVIHPRHARDTALRATRHLSPSSMLVRTLGTNEIVIGSEIIGDERPTVFACLLLVALAHPRRIPRSQLATELWPTAAAPERSHRLRTLLYRCRQLGAPLVSDENFVGLAEAPVIDFREYATTPRCVADARAGAAGVRQVLPGIETMRLGCADCLDDARTVIVATISRWLRAAILLAKRECDWELVMQLADAARTIERANAETWLTLAEAQSLAGRRQDALHTLDEYLIATDHGEEANRLALVLRERIIADDAPLGSHARHVGHDAARQRLWSAFGRAQHGRGGALVVWGAAGIGKTRLLDETARAVVVAESRVIRLSLEALHGLGLFALPRQLIGCLLEEPGAAGCEPDAYQRLRGLASPNAAPIPWQSETLFHDLTELLAALTDESPLVIVMDDAHLVHAETWPLWRALFRWSADRRALWILSARAIHEAELHLLPDRTTAARVDLGALDRHAATIVLASLGVRDDLEHDALFVRVGGSPLLLGAAAQPFDLGLKARADAAVEDSLSRLTSMAVDIVCLASLSEGMRATEVSRQLTASPREAHDVVAELLRAGVLYETNGRLRAHTDWTAALFARYPMSSPPMSAAMIAF